MEGNSCSTCSDFDSFLRVDLNGRTVKGVYVLSDPEYLIAIHISKATDVDFPQMSMGIFRNQIFMQGKHTNKITCYKYSYPGWDLPDGIAIAHWYPTKTKRKMVHMNSVLKGKVTGKDLPKRISKAHLTVASPSVHAN